MKTKDIRLFMAGTASILFLTGCNDWLDPKPLSFYTPENTYNTYSGLKTGTDMLNRDVRYFDYYPTSFSADPCILSEYFFSDMAVNGRTDTGNAPVDLTSDITPSASLTGNNSQINNYWTYLYKGIKDANTLLTRSETAEFESEEQRKEIEGLACFHRAFRYYRLVHQYGDVPFIVNEVAEPRYDFYTTKREAILRRLKSDLETTAPYLSNDVNIGQVTQAAAYHLLAKIDLALGEFDSAIDACNKVIGDGVHELMRNRFGVDASDATKNVIWDLHRPDNKHLPENKEVLYLVLDDYDQTDARSATGLEIMRQVLPMYSATTSGMKTPNGKVAFVDNNETKNLYLKEYGRGICTLRQTWYATHMIWENDPDVDTDMRHAKGNWMKMEYLTYNNPALETEDPEYFNQPLQKYDNNGNLLMNDTIRAWCEWPHYKVFVEDQKANNWRGGWADWYIFRLAETYLLRAEAYIWKGEQGLAANDINEVRGRAGARLISSNEATISMILDERARELFYEEPRKCELTRIAYIYAQTGQADDKGRTYSMDNFSEENFFYNRIMDVTDFYNKGVKNNYGLEYTMQPYHVLWPIAEEAIASNVQGHINQNYGYDGYENNVTPLDGPNE